MAEKKLRPQHPIKERLGVVGGQAVLEGVMMKNKDRCSVAVRKEDGTVTVINSTFTSVRKKHKILNLPLIRGVVNFVEMLILSFSTLTTSAEALGIDDTEPENKFEEWLLKTFGEHLFGALMFVAGILGVALALLIFVGLPALITKGLALLFHTTFSHFVTSLIEGVLKIAIFIAYLSLVSLMKDIRRTFEYHGAEHKSIFCYEDGVELTPENVKKYIRFHPRCGTSFIFIVLIVSILVGALPFLPANPAWLRVLCKLALLPLIVGIGYEFIRFAGRHDNAFTRFLSAPGLWIQRLTTKEPDLEQIAVAIAALKASMPDEFPGYPTEDDDVMVVTTHSAAKRAEEAAKAAAAAANEAAETVTEAADAVTDAADTVVEAAGPVADAAAPSETEESNES